MTESHTTPTDNSLEGRESTEDQVVTPRSEQVPAAPAETLTAEHEVAAAGAEGPVVEETVVVEEAVVVDEALALEEDPVVEETSSVADSALPEEAAATVEPAASAETPVVEQTTGAEETSAPVESAPEPEHVPTPAEIVARPATPSAIPSPALFARSHAGPDLRQYGRVGDDGVVYVKTGETERAVGSYPGANSQGALSYFARKYDEIAAAAALLHQRVSQTDISAKDAEESFAKLTEQAHEPNAVGDLAALEARVTEIGVAVAARKAAEAEQRAAARAEGRTLRQGLVAEAEKIASQSPERTQWKQSGARMRELLDTWKEHQKAGPRLDRTSETALWQRFSAARNSFDRARRVHFAQLDGEQSEAKSTKTRLVAEAERLAVSKDWAPTATAFKRLMDDWRQAGRAGRSDDDALWERFRAAQDSFFAAKDAVVAAEEEGFRANLVIKEALLIEAESILPVTDLERCKAALRSIQDRWDKAGKVPRSDLERTEKALRRIEQGVRDVEEKKWSSSNPEAAARAQSFADQLESAVADLRADLTKAEASGNQKKIDQARAALAAREQWLVQARAGLEEFGG